MKCCVFFHLLCMFHFVVSRLLSLLPMYERGQINIIVDVFLLWSDVAGSQMKTLNRDHGYPLRVIVPGVIGARSVKWLDSINIIAEECQVCTCVNIQYDDTICLPMHLVCSTALQGFFMQKDYKMFPPSVDWDNINWSTRRPQMDFPVQVTSWWLCISCDNISCSLTPWKTKWPIFLSKLP